MTAAPASALISPRELADIIDRADVRIIDGSYGHLPGDATVGIPRAVDFDIDLIADQSAPLTHTVPSPDTFAAEVGQLGISDTDHVIVYDQTGMAFAAARVWWMFRLFGHERVQVLNGGLPAWRASGYPVAPKAPPSAATYTARFRPELLKLQADMLANINARSFTVVDARDPHRFSGTIPEPRPGMASGHIPGSYNVFFSTLINPADGRLLPPDVLRNAFGESRADLSKPVSCSCGSGVTACVLALALHEIGIKDAAVYDGSWTEWATTTGIPVAKGKS